VKKPNVLMNSAAKTRRLTGWKKNVSKKKRLTDSNRIASTVKRRSVLNKIVLR